MGSPAPTRRRRFIRRLCLNPLALTLSAALLSGPALASPPLKVGPQSPSIDWWDHGEKKNVKGKKGTRPKTFLGQPLKLPPKRIKGEKIVKPEDDTGFRIAFSAFGGADFYSFNLDLGNNNRDLEKCASMTSQSRIGSTKNNIAKS